MRTLFLGLLLLGSTSLAATAQVSPSAKPAKPLDRQTYNLHAGENKVGYAQAVLVGKTLHISGTVSQGSTMAEQVEGIYKVFEKTLAHHGLTFQHVVRENVYATDLTAFTQQIELRKNYYNGIYPAATWMEIKRLLMPNALVEIEMTAVKP
ncbi:RidA family protein [Hymenobacter sp. B81]|uniref:RidA family protein n=1 Tax=Hymenobacter sp. B81 TaxID=3344878 RepID=UPI0037DDB7D8